MSMLEGGNFICYRHKFETENINSWNEHCIKMKHTISGSSACVDCGVMTDFNDLPFLKIGQIPPLVPNVKCEKCSK